METEAIRVIKKRIEELEFSQVSGSPAILTHYKNSLKSSEVNIKYCKERIEELTSMDNKALKELQGALRKLE